MKKVLIISSALYLLTTLPASAQIIIQPAIMAPPPPVYYAPAPAYIVAPAPVYVTEPLLYPVHIDHHHRYDWHYWHTVHEHR